MRKIRVFLESAVRAIGPYSRMAERDVKEIQDRISENIPGVVKVYALTWWGFLLVHAGAITSLMLSSWVIALICGKGTLPAAWFAVNLTAFVTVYNAVFLSRWDEEDWRVCENCGHAVRGPSFCDHCGAVAPHILQRLQQK